MTKIIIICPFSAKLTSVLNNDRMTQFNLNMNLI